MERASINEAGGPRTTRLATCEPVEGQKEERPGASYPSGSPHAVQREASELRVLGNSSPSHCGDVNRDFRPNRDVGEGGSVRGSVPILSPRWGFDRRGAGNPGSRPGLLSAAPLALEPGAGRVLWASGSHPSGMRRKARIEPPDSGVPSRGAASNDSPQRQLWVWSSRWISPGRGDRTLGPFCRPAGALVVGAWETRADARVYCLPRRWRWSPVPLMNSRVVPPGCRSARRRNAFCPALSKNPPRLCASAGDIPATYLNFSCSRPM